MEAIPEPLWDQDVATDAHLPGCDFEIAARGLRLI